MRDTAIQGRNRAHRCMITEQRTHYPELTLTTSQDARSHLAPQSHNLAPARQDTCSSLRSAMHSTSNSQPIRPLALRIFNKPSHCVTILALKTIANGVRCQLLEQSPPGHSEQRSPGRQTAQICWRNYLWPVLASFKSARVLHKGTRRKTQHPAFIKDLQARKHVLRGARPPHQPPCASTKCI